MNGRREKSGLTVGWLCGLFLLLFLFAGAALAEEGAPKRLWASPDGVKTKSLPSELAPVAPFALGFDPEVQVIGRPPIKADVAFVMKVADKWPGCMVERVCGGLAYVNCRGGAGAYYVTGSLDIVAACGGACEAADASCACPPDEWNCN